MGVEVASGSEIGEHGFFCCAKAHVPVEEVI